MTRYLLGFGVILTWGVATAEPLKPAREALQPLHSLVGVWNASGVPEGSREEKQKGHWIETLEVQWKFKDADAWLDLKFTQGKYFTRGEIRATKEANRYTIQLETLERVNWTFNAVLQGTALTGERVDASSGATQKLIFSLLHDNRITYRFESKPAGKSFFTRLYTVGATRNGEEFAKIGVSERECVVTGGTGTSTVSYQGKTYYVCCSGCKDEFNANPAKYVAAFEKKRAEANREKK